MASFGVERACDHRRSREDRTPVRSGRADCQTPQLGERLPDGKGELCAGAQACVRRKAPVNGDARAVNSVPSTCNAARQKPAREFFSAPRVVPNDLDCLGATRGEEQRRAWRRRAEAAKHAAERAVEIEQPEMEARRRLDEDAGIG